MESERLKTNYPEDLTRALRQWLPIHGYKYSTELAAELGIPKQTWNRSIISGDNIVESIKGNLGFDTRIFYARLHLWTDLDEADPRNIPDRLGVTPRGIVSRKSRNFTEAEYQSWLTNPEAQELLARKNERFQRETILAAEQETHQPPVPTETVGMFIGTFIDEILRRGATQVAEILSELRDDLVSAQFRDFADRIGALESVIAKTIVQTRLGQEIQPAQPQRPSRINTTDIGQIASRLRDLLNVYHSGTSEDRDKLMQTYGNQLMALDIVVHTLTRRSSEREESLKLSQETKL